MKQSIKKSLLSLLTLILLASCTKKESLQTYFVDNQETASFTTIDIPTSLVNFASDSLSEDEKDAFESVNKLNFLGFKLDSNNLNVSELKAGIYILKINQENGVISTKRFIKK